MSSTPASSGTVLVANDAGVTRLTLNRPSKLNAFNRTMHGELKAALEAAAQDGDCRVIVLSGAGRAFSAGQDLADGVYYPNGPQPDLGEIVDAHYSPLIRLIRALPKPVIAAVNGMAAGAGANVALACDLVFAARSATFMQAFAKIGLIPDSGGTWVLPRLAGDARARGLAILAEPLTADRAEAWGLIWRAVDDDKLEAEVDAVAAHLATAPTYGIGLIKQALLASAGNSLDQQLDLERDLQRKAGQSPDYAEGVAAFLAKRPARFTGGAS